MSAGLLASARGEWPRAGYYLMVLSAHAALAYLAAAAVARDLYFRGYSRVQGSRSNRRRMGFYALDEVFHRLFFFVPPPIRLLLLKDLRTFCRDPAQWSQFLIFFGLLAFYFLNIPRLGYGVQSPSWRNLVSFLNLSVTALILSTFTSRFIFPLLSLEGRNFWVLGLLPLGRKQILWGKFAFSVGISLLATEGLVFLSDLMLGMGPVMIALHLAMVAVLCAGLSGISVGLGARLPNLRETDPSKIAVGFGGTLNLLVSLVYIFAIVTAMAIPCHLYFLGIEHPGATSLALSHAGFRFGLDRGGPGQPARSACWGRSSRCESESRRSSGWNSERGPDPCDQPASGRAEGVIAKLVRARPSGRQPGPGRVWHRPIDASARCTISFTRCLVTL